MGEDVEMVEAEGGKVAGKKRAREDKGKGKAVEEAETEGNAGSAPYNKK